MAYTHVHIKNLSLKSSQLCIWLIQKYRRFRVVSDSVLVSAFGISISCKHSPTCSEYTILQIQKHGTIRGLFKGVRRILTCW